MICKFCEKECKNDNSLRNHERLCKSNPKRQIVNIESARIKAYKKHKCQYCNDDISLVGLSKHEKHCKSNPKVMNEKGKNCPICEVFFISSSTTCSYSCSNTFFRSGSDNPNWKEENYRSTCWEHHEKKCVICREEKIVAVHHYDLNHNNNVPENLVPLCPTHHQYVHSRYSSEVQSQIDDYVKIFKLRFA